MKLLALDSSGLVASVAVMTEDALIAEYTVNYKKTHSQTLLPMLDEIVKMIDADLNDMDAIAIAAGPGSFTGLRIGSATAKGLGLALNKPLISVPTLEGIAYNLCGSKAVICPMMDARRNQVYTGLYRFGAEGFEIIADQKACPVTEILEEVNQLGQEVIFLGDGVPVYDKVIKEMVTVLYTYAAPHMSKQRAGAVAARALDLYKEGKVETAADHAPEYLRKSQAEREFAKKQKALGQANVLEEMDTVTKVDTTVKA